MKPIFLIGYMCAGKTTLGRALAQAADITYIDLDDYVTSSAGMSVTEIFATYGEEHFRRLESEALVKVAGLENVVIGCGGGTPLRSSNMELMNRRGRTVHLIADNERLLTRLLEGRHKRPLIADLDDKQIHERMLRGLAERRHFYALAAETFDSTFLENESEIARTVDKFINTFNLPRR
ncbi:MAG: shikimate kinase [Lachnoclostridium sp.]|nr:shikimate kinase [Lachnoclostridium sp.]